MGKKNWSLVVGSLALGILMFNNLSQGMIIYGILNIPRSQLNIILFLCLIGSLIWRGYFENEKRQ